MGNKSVSDSARDYAVNDKDRQRVSEPHRPDGLLSYQVPKFWGFKVLLRSKMFVDLELHSTFFSSSTTMAPDNTAVTATDNARISSQLDKVLVGLLCV